MDKHPRKFIIKVTEIDVQPNGVAGHDAVVVQWAGGKLMPSVEKRIIEAFSAEDYTFEHRVMAG